MSTIIRATPGETPDLTAIRALAHLEETNEQVAIEHNGTLVSIEPGDTPASIYHRWRATKDGQDREQPDMVNHPPHYRSHPSGVECITVVEHMGFNLGNAIKYIWRADEKAGGSKALEDLEKARWYIERELQRRAAQ